MKLIIGLGNPGIKYEKTRHNLGFSLLDVYAKKHLGPEIVWELDRKFQVEILKQVQDDGSQLMLIKPLTFMNNSGQAVVALADYFKITAPEDIVIIHDDLDLILGKIKIRQGGAAGGHHGVESIINALGSDKFVRLRLGIGNERSHSGEHSRIAFNAEHFVLESFMPNEHSKVKHMLKQAVGALEALLNKGFEVAQNQYN
ncbi:aminoacyl-tRNA hydrolase [Candidatus Daviesbacteria bacterium RIFCSPHIGHO2_12_FULL_37_11]|uniref:Peptidyl-tRNA hydrolase n=1 Tax=Candidatus Daviesbacteria bacterium RIFCSPHIGHO2_12_FULL_37_11 TaxID=1797777 RepID=A0A1F5KA47_9BACT|nr:MAG: aminoacyl-tRNA hydrolase [Candidatus Daviesbacteria bacterium GWA1_38_6]OGE18290.1 MAG: aminoacyl-tRNA hydrolase [Candidatus Daviesbacteria bacterium RIFCSPHIGHO2_01_FULL_37_27]OGE37823.1 MAG: aminoacyl-tRNA hydrolase [Candidatus Daviesbacteria bacterium RIFCSPHIGHO2_12_FULL_37_11]OGE45455.1 MAG: aminoacyl-tRNA hydrolase [Candidatus Daviesbacteria bacterium RIFCSPLOWO2_01_FULL_37_10]